MRFIDDMLWEYESYIFLKYLAQQGNYADNLEKRKMQSLVSLFKKIEDTFRQNAVDIGEWIPFYFGKLEMGYVCKAVLVILADEAEMLNRVFKTGSLFKDVATEYNTDHIRDYYREFYNLLMLGDEDLYIQEDEDKNLEELVQIIMNKNISNDEKMILMDLLVNHDKHKANLKILLHRAQDVLLLYREELEAVRWNSVNLWREYEKHYSIVETMEQIIPDYVKKKTAEEYLYISVMQPFVIGAGITVDDTIDDIIYIVGSLVEIPVSPAEFLKKHSVNQNEHFLMMLRLMGESSKFDILNQLSDHEMYGHELVKSTGLTTGTVSHHMTALIANNMVAFRTEGRKTYYTLNTSEIERLIQFIDQLLHKKRPSD